MNNKTIGSLLIFGVAIIGVVKLIQKPESKERAKFEIEKEVVNTIEAKSSVASEAIKTNEVANIVEQQPQEPNADKKMEQKPPSRFGMQSSDETLASFEQEEILDAGWAYTQEQLIYNLLTQEVYANEAVKTAEQVRVECKTETCLITTKLESAEQLQEFYRAFIKIGKDKKYEFVPVITSPEETIFAIYPPKP